MNRRCPVCEMDNAEDSRFRCGRCGAPLRVDKAIAEKLATDEISSTLLNNLRERSQESPNDPRAHFALAEALLSERLLEAARREYSIVKALDPEHLMAYVRMGQIAGHSGDDDGFAVNFLKAFELDPTNTLVLRGLAQFYGRVGNLPRKLEMLHRLRAENTGDLSIHVEIEKLQKELSKLEVQ